MGTIAQLNSTIKKLNNIMKKLEEELRKQEPQDKLKDLDSVLKSINDTQPDKLGEVRKQLKGHEDFFNRMPTSNKQGIDLKKTKEEIKNGFKTLDDIESKERM